MAWRTFGSVRVSAKDLDCGRIYKTLIDMSRLIEGLRSLMSID